MTDDVRLLRQYAETGAEEAFAALVGRNLDFVYATATLSMTSTQTRFILHHT